MTGVPVWDDGDWQPLPVLDGDLDTDVCVVGLGGSGLACIGELLALGLRVVGVDAGAVAGGAAGRNGGFLLAGLPAFYHHAAQRFGRERVRAIHARTLAEIDRMDGETPEAVRRVGSLRIAVDPAERDDCDQQLAALRQDGFAVEAYHGPEGDGLLFPADGAFNPLQRCRTLACRAMTAGARLFEASPATDITGRCVRTTHGTVHCRHAVIAVDGNLEILVPELSGRVRTARLQMLATEPLAERRFPRPVYQRWGYEYWQQLADGRLALGGLRDRAGESEWTGADRITDDLQSALERLLHDQLHVHAAITHRWAGVVGYSHDGLPVIANVRPGVWAIGGYSGTGNVLGALCGRGVARIIARDDDALVRELVG